MDAAEILAEMAACLEKIERNIQRLRGRVKQLQLQEIKNPPKTLEGPRLVEPPF